MKEKEMEIKEPKFKVGDKVTTLSKVGEVLGTISGIKYYDLQEGTYIYKVKFDRDDFTDESYLDQFVLDAYIEKPKTVWDLKEGNTYYSIYANGNVSSEKKWFDDDYEKNYRSLGNCFLTKEEAETEVERRKIETEMLRLGGTRKINELNSNIVYTIQMHFGLKYVYVRSFDIKQAPIGVIFFNYRKQAIKALETIGESKIKKYLFGVDE